MSDALVEIVELLASQQLEVRKGAAEIIEGLTGSPEGLQQLNSVSGSLLPALLRRLSDDTAVSQAVLTALVNLSQDERVVTKLVELSVVGRCVDYLKDGSSQHLGLLAMLLSNVTLSKPGAASLLQLSNPQLQGYHMAVILQLLVRSSSAAANSVAESAANSPAAPGPSATSSRADQDPLGHLAAVVNNVTQFKEGRTLLVSPGSGGSQLPALASQLTASNPKRRWGCASALHNCCFHAQPDGTLDALLRNKDTLSSILAALCGLGQPQEPDAEIRERLADSILLVAQSDAGRKKLWELQAPEALRKGYEMEQHPGVCESMEGCAELFLGDNGSVQETAPPQLGWQHPSAAA
ncbi:hypothetical protein WJX74_000656 [Apatococcus lobatus]|uniref:Protein HGH1 N-terminal domain-containing protein n=1 Tax=Apatococcus lobatus TaxID=904363 RepID=A0AAW1QZ76_9CHLO